MWKVILGKTFMDLCIWDQALNDELEILIK